MKARQILILYDVILLSSDRQRYNSLKFNITSVCLQGTFEALVNLHVEEKVSTRLRRCRCDDRRTTTMTTVHARTYGARRMRSHDTMYVYVLLNYS